LRSLQESDVPRRRRDRCFHQPWRSARKHAVSELLGSFKSSEGNVVPSLQHEALRKLWTLLASAIIDATLQYRPRCTPGQK